MPNLQPELNFGATKASGLDAWREAQKESRDALARSLGLPLGQEVEVWLQGGVRLRGVLRLREESLFHVQCTIENTRFELSGVPFSYSEMESCVRL